MGHAHATGSASARVRHALRWSLVFNGVFLLVEAAVGFWSGSLALLSDAAHMVSDVSALALALVVAELTRRPASSGRTFGLVRAEVIGAFVNAVVLVGACVLLASHAITRLSTGATHFEAQPVLLVASGQIAEGSLTACLEKSVGAGGGSVSADTDTADPTLA